MFFLSKPDTGTTNGLRHGTQFGVPVELVTLCVKIRGHAWRCGSDETVRAMLWREFCNVQKKFPKCHDLSCRDCRVTFVNSSKTMSKLGTTVE